MGLFTAHAEALRLFIYHINGKNCHHFRHPLSVFLYLRSRNMDHEGINKILPEAAKERVYCGLCRGSLYGSSLQDIHR
jgi:hypothetical protein